MAKRELTWLSNNENEEGELPAFVEKVLSVQHVRRKYFHPNFFICFGTATGLSVGTWRIAME